jgi:cation diffusion facilitator family transporter
MTSYETSKKVSAVGLFVNTGLAIVKISVGIIAGSEALLADGIDSGSDIFKTTVIYLSLFYAHKPKDADHPYGHGKIEQFASIFISIALLYLIGSLVYNVSKSLYDAYVLKIAIVPPTSLAIVGGIFSLLVKIWLYKYTYKAGKQANSPAVMAISSDYRSDIYAGIGVLIGISGSILGLPVLDPLAALVVAGLIARLSYSLAKEAIGDLLDKAIPSDIVDEIKCFLLKEPDVVLVEEIQGRRMGSKYILDICVSFPTFYSLKHTHDVTHAVEERLLSNFQYLSQVNLHIHAVSSDDESQRRFNMLERILRESVSEELSYHRLKYSYTSEDESISLHLLFHTDIRLSKAHEIATNLEKRLIEIFPKANITIHMEPDRSFS